MNSLVLTLSAVLTVVSAAVYLVVGRRLSARDVGAGKAHLAWSMFVAWWYALAAATAMGAVTTLLAVAGIDDLSLHIASTALSLLLICVALMGLLHYIVYLYTGVDMARPLAILYFSVYGVLLYLILDLEPTGVQVERLSATMTFANEPDGVFAAALLLLLIGPPLVAAMAYLSLGFRARDRDQRYRIFVVSLSFIVWFGLSVASQLAGISDTSLGQIATRVIGLLAAIAIYQAYLPSPAIQRRLGVSPVVAARLSSGE